MAYDYPELYYRVYPKIINEVNDYLLENESCREISEEIVEPMVNRVYKKLVEECLEIHEDPVERRMRPGRSSVQQRPFYGRSRIIRDLIRIFIISELLRRNRLLYPF